MSDPKPLLTEAARAHAAGRSAEAERLVRRALALRPGHPPALRSLGVLALEGGRWAEAEASFSAALAADPNARALQADIGIAQREQGRLPEALRSLSAAARDLPNSAPVRYHLAVTLRRAGALDLALQELRALSDLSPLDPEPWVLIAEVSLLRGDARGAEAGYRRALALRRPQPAVSRSLGQLLGQQGRAAEAIPVLVQALRESPTELSLYSALVDALFVLPAATPELEPLLLALLERDDIDHQRLERVIRALLPEPSAWPESPLAVGWLRRTLAADPSLEPRLRAERGRLLGLAEREEPVPIDWIEALALQSWYTEHAGRAAPGERERARALSERADPAALAAFALFFPLDELPELRRRGLLRPGWEQRPLARLVRRSLVEPAEEERLARGLPALFPVSDPTSVAVQAQYEAHPYPRLVGLHRPAPTRLSAWLGELFPTKGPWEGLDVEPVSVLVAGCGTGQQPISVARRLPGARVLGVDLSRRSLGRAARLAREAAVTNTRFAVADLQDLGVLPERFSFIDCVGVLHHLADPARGLAVLRKLLRPGGVLRLGLYSERARAEVVAARALIAERGWLPDDDGLDRMRAAALDAPEESPLAPLRRSIDLWTRTGLRDLVFHPCEHRFTPLGLQALLEGASLELLGFQALDPTLLPRYRAANPQDPSATDLAGWEAFEAQHPRSFAGMFLFWCRPRG